MVPITTATMQMLVLTVLVTGTAAASLAEEDEGRVLGGKPCAVGTRPYQAALLRNGRSFCGGSLVHPKWVLTAAHCSRNIKSVRVHLGDYNLKVREGTEQIRKIRSYHRHPRFKTRGLDNDFMLLELNKPVQLNDFVKTIRLATCCPVPEMRCRVSGWGTITSPTIKRPDILQCADLYTVSQDRCLETYPGNITENMFCAGVEQGGISSCKGDSGGPLVCNGRLQGVVSWGKPICGLPREPRVYANVCKAARWVRNTIQRRQSESA